MKTVLLISGKVLHYRVSVYNYHCRRFKEHSWDFKVLADSLQPNNQRPVRFELRETPFNFRKYRQIIREINPDVVILFVHLKEPVFWPLLHWLKMAGISVVFWTKGANLDEPESRWRYHMFNYVHGLSDALILYSGRQANFLKPQNRAKAIPANNTINFEEIPTIAETREQIKAEFGLPFQKMVLFAGTMGLNGERKKVEHLIEIFRTTDRTDIGAVLVGSGLPENLKSRINPKNTRHLGPVHDPEDRQISKLFKASDLFVVPGHIGLGLNQAFHWGLPVVTEEGNQPPEIQTLKNGRNGFMVPQDDINQLKEKIFYLLDHDQVRAEFSRNARHDIQAEASIEGMFQGFLRAVDIASTKKSKGRVVAQPAPANI